MKARLIFICMLFTALQVNAQWNQPNPVPRGDALTKILFTDEMTGYACSGSYIIKTIDGGSTWTVTENGIDNRDIDFTDSQKGFSAGDQGIWMTADGGDTWDPVETPVMHLKQVMFTDAMHGFARKSDSVICTRDGGYTWQLCNSPGIVINDMFFSDSLNGYVVNYTSIRITYDGGNTWVNNPIGFTSSHDVYFKDGIEGFVLCDPSYICHTSDGGQNWGPVFIPQSQTSDLTFISHDTAFICGSHCIIRSTDGGQTWFKVDSASYEYYSVAFRNQLEGFAVGYDGIIAKSVDGGTTWNIADTITKVENNTVRNVPLYIFPNPARDRLIIGSDDGLGKGSAALFDLTGRKIMEVEFSGGLKEIRTDVSSVGKGTYVMRVTEKQRIRSARIIIR